MSVEFFITSMVIILLPGTGVLYTLAWGLGKGFKASFVAAFGCTLGILPHMTASAIGLAALLHTSATAFQVIKFLGVAYLIYMAWSTLREKGALNVSENHSEAKSSKIITNGFLLNILNPKLSIFFLAFLPQFVPPGAASPTLSMLALGAIFMMLTFIVFVGYGAFASATRTYVISKPKVMVWMRRLFAGAFGVIGLKLALSEQ